MAQEQCHATLVVGVEDSRAEEGGGMRRSLSGNALDIVVRSMFPDLGKILAADVRKVFGHTPLFPLPPSDESPYHSHHQDSQFAEVVVCRQGNQYKMALLNERHPLSVCVKNFCVWG